MGGCGEVNTTETLEELLELSTMALATCGEGGIPHAAPVYFAADKNYHFYFFSSLNSQHSIDIEDNPQAAAAIYRECTNWQDIQGLQIRGFIEIVSTLPGKMYAWKIFSKKFPFVINLKQIIQQNRFYVFKAQWIRLIDNRLGFGFKQEWNL
jgi:uncharacterized protein YhbP (UPF0306 family)